MRLWVSLLILLTSSICFADGTWVGGGTVDGVDPTLTMKGFDNDGVVRWDEDLDFFDIQDELRMLAGEQITFRDSAIGIYSQADTFLDLFADGSVRIGDSSAGAPTNYVEIEADGDANFVGGAGLQFAQIYEEAGSSTLALAAQDTFYQVAAFTVNGASNGSATPDHTNDHITVGKAGCYLVSINIAFSQTTAVSVEYDFHVFTNNGSVGFPQISAHRDTNGAGTIGSTGAAGIIDVAASDTVEVWVARRTGAAVARTITFSTVSLNVVQIGGT